MFEYKDINDLTEKELIQLIGHNIIEATFSRKKIDNMKKAANKSSNCRINFDKNKRNKKEIQQKKIDTSFEDEIEFYLENIKKVDNEELINSLPSRNNGNYKRIMIRLQAECLKEIKEINEIIESELDNLHEEDLKYIQGEVSIYKEKISIIKNELERNDLPEFIEEKDEIKNRLVFLTTEKGNVKALDDLKNIPREYYFSIEELFLSIINGTFKNVKPFTNNNVLVGIAEVKNFKTRVIFSRIGKNEYAILTTFMKKTDNDRGYLDFIKRVAVDYKNQKGLLKSKINDEEFMNAQEEITKELFNRLSLEEDKNMGSVMSRD